MVNHSDVVSELFDEVVLHLYTVYQQLALRDLGDSQESVDESCFACPCTTHNSYFLSGFDTTSDSFEGIRQIHPIPRKQITELDVSFGYHFSTSFFFAVPVVAVL